MPTTFELRDGSQTTDPRLDRLRQFDERSRAFPVAAVIPPTITRGRTWSVPPRLDQGREGACVGFGVSHELASYPAAVPSLTNDFAHNLYKQAQKIDPWEGENYEGTSVLAGVKVAKSWGYFDEYRWCFSVEDMLRALSTEGPIVVGTDWYDSMYSPQASGLVKPGQGSVIGGHCWLIRGFQLKPTFASEPVFRARNSWGGDWGVSGDFFVTVSDYEKHLMPGGEQVVFMGRHKYVSTPAAQGTRFTDPLRFWR